MMRWTPLPCKTSRPSESLIEYPSRFPIKVMGANADGFVHAVTQIARSFDPAFDADDHRAAPEQGRQLPRRDDHRHRHQPRAARRALPHAVARIRWSRSCSDGPPTTAAIDRLALGRVGYAATFAAMQHSRARARADTADRALALRAPARLHAGPGRQGRARPGSGGHSGRADRPRRPGHLPRSGPGRGLSADRPATRSAIYVKEYVYRIEEAVIRTLDAFRRHRPPRGRRAGHLCAARRPRSAMPRCPAPCSPTTRFAGLGKIAALGIKVSRHCTYHGVALNVAMDLRTLRPHQPLRLCRAENRRSFYNRRSHHLGRSGAGAGRQARRLPRTLSPPREAMSTLNVVRDAQSPETTTRSPSRRPPPRLSRIPDQDRAGRNAEEARLDPRQGRLADDPLLRDQADPARAQAAHGVRGSLAARTSANASATAPPPS